MLIEMKSTNEQCHVPSGTGKALIAANLAVEVIPEVKKLEPNAQFSVRRGRVVGDYEYPPYIYGKCSTCGGNTVGEGPTVHKTMTLRHQGTCFGVPATPVPPHIQDEYESRRAAYKKRFKRFQPENGSAAVDRVRDQKVAAGLGLKSREQLIAEAKALPVPK